MYIYISDHLRLSFYIHIHVCTHMDATPLNTTMIFKIKIQLPNFIYIKHDKLQLTKNEVDIRTIKIVDPPQRISVNMYKKLSTV